MRLDQALVERGLAPSRARAQALIREGHVRLDGCSVIKPGARVTGEDALTLADEAHDFVSRAALKLHHGLEAFGVDPQSRIALDVGASTGGFTDVLLRRGAEKVYAVDVGTDQLHTKLREDPRVVSLEGVNAKEVTAPLIPDIPSLIVCDVSFISLLKALPQPLSLASRGAHLITLVKPQFELGPDAIGKKGRVLTPPDEQRSFIDRVIAPGLAGFGWDTIAVTTSPILGGDGTLEFLLHAQKTTP